MRRILLSLGLLAAATMAVATTIERLSMDEMIAKSTRIVRGKALRADGIRRGGIIYTDYQFQVSEAIKGVAADSLALSVPGGALGQARQSFAGTPALALGQEYVVFVWTSRAGVNHIIGLSQGLFTAGLNQAGETVLSRGPAGVQVVDRNGKTVADAGAEITWSELKRRVRGVGGVAQ